jgi:glycosyltransferase involved in cell wall biosynthesis
MQKASTINHPLITVLMPVYNGEKYLAEAIDSILNQTYKDFEFLIINDGSSDKTDEIISSYDDSRIRHIISDMNLGIIKSLNKGIKLSKGEYIARMDADDISCPERFNKQIQFMNTHPSIAVCGTFTEIFYCKSKKQQFFNLPIDNEAIKAHLFFNSPFVHSSVMFRKSTIDSNIFYYNKKYIYAEDYELWCRISNCGYQLANIPQVLLNYRYHLNNISLIKSTQQQKNAFKISLSQLKIFLNRKIISDKELNLHKAILGHAQNHNISINDLVNWCLFLWEQNLRINKYYKKYFMTYLTFAWKTALKNSNSNFLKQIYSYLYSIIKGHVYFKNFIFFIKLSFWCFLQDAVKLKKEFKK